MKKFLAFLLVFGILLAGTERLQAATVGVLATVQSSLSLSLDETELDFGLVQPGAPSITKQLAAIITGSGERYNLLLSNTPFAHSSSTTTLPASTLLYKLSESGAFVKGSETPAPLFEIPRIASPEGDKHIIDFQLHFFSGTASGQYKAIITIVAAPQ